jgi:alpha-ribazole phosphatase
MEIYLIRHSTTEIEKGVCYGQTDIPLAESFSDEAHQLLSYLPTTFDAVFSSSSSRCIKLARLIKSKQLIIDNRLLEMNFGDWEMKKWDEINQEALNKWMQDFVNVRVPQGENFIDLYKRVCDFMENLKKTNYQKIAIVTHAGVIRSFVSKILDRSLEKAFEIQVNYCSITKINMAR